MQNRERSFGGIVPRKSTSLAIRSHDEDESTISVALKSSLSGLLSFIGCGLVLISVAAVVAYSNADPDAIISPISLAALFPAAFAGGFTTVKRTGGSPLLCGVLKKIDYNLGITEAELELWGTTIGIMQELGGE